MPEKVAGLPMKHGKCTLVCRKPKKHVIPKRSGKLGQNGVGTMEFDDDLGAPCSNSSLPIVGDGMLAR